MIQARKKKPEQEDHVQPPADDDRWNYEAPSASRGLGGLAGALVAAQRAEDEAADAELKNGFLPSSPATKESYKSCAGAASKGRRGGGRRTGGDHVVINYQDEPVDQLSGGRSFYNSSDHDFSHGEVDFFENNNAVEDFFLEDDVCVFDTFHEEDCAGGAPATTTSIHPGAAGGAEQSEQVRAASKDSSESSTPPPAPAPPPAELDFLRTPATFPMDGLDELYDAKLTAWDARREDAKTKIAFITALERDLEILRSQAVVRKQTVSGVLARILEEVGGELFL